LVNPLLHNLPRLVWCPGLKYEFSERFRASRLTAKYPVVWAGPCLGREAIEVSQSIVRPLRRWDPERIGPYTIVGRLGAGAMGQVFLARSAAGRLVAVKTIRVELAEEPGFRARFAREVAAARRVSGVFTAAVVASDPDADLPWVATAYVPAPPLSSLVKRCGPLPVPAVRWLAAGCAEALESIHGVGLLHRDIKPSNVLVAPDGPRVIDFGVARAAERVQLTVTHGAAGTPAYMAPEQARDASQASPASDVFSLGATLVYAATGHPPYRGETVMDILIRLATEPPDLTGVPAELAGLLVACLDRVPRDRPTDAAIIEGLGPFAAGPVVAGSGGAGHSYLPDSAMEVVAEYAGSPRFPAFGGDGDADGDEEDAAGGATHGSGISLAASAATSGSHTALPGFHSLAAGAMSARSGSPRAEPASAGPAPDGFARAEFAGAGSASTGIAGDGSGHDGFAGDGSARDGFASDRSAGDGSASGGFAGAGSARAGHWPPSREGRSRRLLPRPRADGQRGRHRPSLVWSVRAAAAVVLLAAGAALGLSLRGPAQAADSRSGPTAPPPCVAPGASGAPVVCVSQPYGDGNTVFVLHGSGFAPGTRVTVRLAGHGVSPIRPMADLQGTFSYAIDQGHYFFPGQIPPGTYSAVATGTNGSSASASFTVGGPQGGPPPGQPPGAP